MSKNIPSLLFELEHLLHSENEIMAGFKKRIDEGNVTRDEDPATHLCAFFAAIDSSKKKVFIGHHKKSGLWIFNGGHLDKGETVRQAVEREIGEEWGLGADMLRIEKPAFLTITPIENPNKACKVHFDIWHFIDVDMDTFDPDPDKLAEETYETRWLDLTEARRLSEDATTLSGYDFIEKEYFI